MSEAIWSLLIGGAFAALNLIIAGVNQYRTTQQNAGVKKEESAFDQLTRIYSEARADIKAQALDLKAQETEINNLRSENEALRLKLAMHQVTLQ